MSNPAVFLDRDGTLNEDPGYLGKTGDVKLFPGTGEALASLKNQDFLLIVISNQSGIARGILSKSDVEAVNNKINLLLNEFGVQIDEFYFCHAHPDFSTAEECECRKPSPKLIFEAAGKYDIDIDRSYIIGDSVSDIECGWNAKLKPVLVKTGRGMESFSVLQKENKIPSFVAENIMDASNFILNDFHGASN